MLKAFALTRHLSFMYNKITCKLYSFGENTLTGFCLSANKLTGYGKFISG